MSETYPPSVDVWLVQFPEEERQTIQDLAALDDLPHFLPFWIPLPYASMADILEKAHTYRNLCLLKKQVERRRYDSSPS